MSRLIPTYENGQWTTTEFDTTQEFIDFLLGIFKEPGQYQYDETSFLFNEQAINFNKNGFYCSAPFRSKDFNTYWEAEKEKCRNGAIFKNNGNTWYLTRDYYMWLTFFLSMIKKKRNTGLPK